ncbi:MAG: pentapeptide repeat-containing protein [Alphaproteobacteria bacterium]|nr:pentapeptide repeat-containing protein [Alphaproteobacteria bacterium]
MLTFLLVWLGLAQAAETPAELAGVEDPRRFEAAADAARDAGDSALAEHLYREMLTREELSRYADLREYLVDALVLERLGRSAESAAKYREGIVDNVLSTYQVLRTHSVHPDRDALANEAAEYVRTLAAAADRGENAVIYHTKKGAPRSLEKVTVAEVLAASKKGDFLRYCWLPSLDLRGVDLTGVQKIDLNRCVIGSVELSGVELPALWMSGFVLGDANLGKTWTGEKNKSVANPPGHYGELVLADAVFLGATNLSGVEMDPHSRAYFQMSVFDGPVDFAGAELSGTIDFRYATFGADANFRLLKLDGPAYFANTRFRANTRFSGMRSSGPLYFASARFDGEAQFDACEWLDKVSFENARFAGPASFGTTRIPNKRLNLSRADFASALRVEEVHLGGLDAFGTHFASDTRFTDTTIDGRARFSVDRVTRSTFASNPDGMRVLYREYQGDEDADEPLTTQNSYGVQSADDLTARIDGDISFANTAFRAYTVFEGVTFGTSATNVASFYNAQLLGETHFERSLWNARADFRTIFGKEVAFNEATFRDSFVLDDAYVDGRIALTDATFEDTADWSFYAAAFKEFQLDTSHVDHPDGGHRLFYEHCARGLADPTDPRIADVPEAQRVKVCFDRVLDEFVGLKEAYGAEAMIEAEDDAYWWFKHHETMAQLHSGNAFQRIGATVFGLGLFELCFGWGVELGNLGVAVLVITALFAVFYRAFCPDTMLSYDGENVRVRDVSYVGMFFVSLQTLMAINTGWDFGDDDHRFRYLNTLETLIGYIILTFFVGAYTRMILA